jgi:putative ABC transport system permease protein
VLALLAGLIRGHRARLLIFALLSGLAVAAAAAIPAWTDAARTGTAAREVGDASDGARSVRISGNVSAAPARLTAAFRDAAGLLPAARFARFGTATTSVSVTGPAVTGGVRVFYVEDVCGRLLVEGACATGPGEVTLTPATATTFGVAVGDRLDVQGGRTPPVPLTVTGLHRPADRSADFWTARTASYLPLDAGALIGDPGTFQLAGAETVEAVWDFVLRTDVPFDRDTVAADLAAVDTAPLGRLVTVTSLPDLLTSLRGNEESLLRGATVTTAQIGLLCGFVLLLAAARLAGERRDESALAALRGAPAGTRAIVAVVPGLLAVPVAAPLGLLAGYGGAVLAARAEFGTAPSPGPSLLWAGVAALGCVVLIIGAAVAYRPRGPVLEGLRRTPSRLRIRPLDAVTLIVVALAVAARYEIAGAGAARAEGVALFGPALFALAGSLIVVRLVPPLAGRIATNRLRAGHLGSGLAALQIARRPGGHQVLALFAITIALLVQAVTAADLAARAAVDRARWEVGASRVLQVGAATPEALRTAVHAADPDGRWAMPALRTRHAGAPLLAVEPDRLLAVVARPRSLDLDRLRELTGVLHVDGNAPVLVDGTELMLDVEVTGPAVGVVTAYLVDPAGARLAVEFVVPEAPGRVTTRAPVSGCDGGCRLSHLGFNTQPNGLRLHELRQDGPARTVLTAAEMGAPGRWRPGFNLPAEQVTLEQDGDWLAATFRKVAGRTESTETRLRLADTPVPVPVLAAAPELTTRSDQVRALTTFDTGSRPVTVAGGLSALPGIGTDGFMIDYGYAVRLLESAPVNAAYEVWLAADAPAGLVDTLRAAGLTVEGERSLAERAGRLQAQGPGQATRLYLAAALFALVLALVGAMLTVTVERPRRAADLAALRAQGLPGPVAAAAARWDRVVLVLAGVAAGALLGALSRVVHLGLLPVFADRAKATVPVQGWWAGLAVLAATAVLLLAAFAGGRREHRP